MSDLGRVLIIFGAVLVGVGVLVMLAGKIPWLGKLPGDFTYKGDHFTFYFPLGTSIVISVVLSVLFYLFRR